MSLSSILAKFRSSFLLGCLLFSSLSFPTVSTIHRVNLIKQPVADLTMLQFKSGNAILGFQRYRVVMPAFDHTLIITFEGTPGAKPQTTAVGKPTSVESPQPASIPALGKVTYPNLWPGIDLAYTSGEGLLVKSTYTLAPGAGAADIRLSYNVPASLQKDGSLALAFPSGVLTESRPIAWQIKNGQKQEVAVDFHITSPSNNKINQGSQVGFILGSYNHRLPLVIDPAYAWHTFYGGPPTSDFNEATALATGPDGSLYIAGYSPTTWNGPSPSNMPPINAFTAGSTDFVVMKLNPNGSYAWHTFFGSDQRDMAYAIAIDPNPASNAIYVTGFSNYGWVVGTNLPLHDHTSGSNQDIVVIKLGTDGSYQWHTFYGSPSSDIGYGIAVDSNSDIYITGYSASPWVGPASENPLHLSGYYVYNDIMILKLDSSGSYIWHTFYGGTNSDTGKAIAVSNDSIYITGLSYLSWQATFIDPDDHSHTIFIDPLNPGQGGSDIMVMKLGLDGSYQWHTFYGTNGTDSGSAIVLDSAGYLYVTGSSDDNWTGPDPMDTPPLNPQHGKGKSDIFILKLDTSGTYQWHTFFGSSIDDNGYGIALDSFNNVYVVGSSNGSWVGPSNQAPLYPYTGDTDIAVVKVDQYGQYRWHAFYGSTGTDVGDAIALDSSSRVDMVGRSFATWSLGGVTQPLNPFPGSPFGAITAIQMAGRSQTTLGISSTQNPSYFSQPVTITAQVVAQSGYTATGTVTFTIAGTPTAPITLINGSASVTTSALLAGNLQVTATYSGDSDLLATNNQSSPYHQVVSQAVTTLALTSPYNPATFGQPFNLTAQVYVFPATAMTLITGTVSFKLDGKAYGNPLPLDSNNKAVLTPSPPLAPGDHVFDVVYSGDANTLTSSVLQWHQTINRIGTSMVLNLPSGSTYSGQSVTFTVAVNVLPPASGNLNSGSVLFQVDDFSIGQTVLVVNGQATSDPSGPLDPGVHTVKASYISGTNYANNSVAETLIVDKAVPQIQLKSSANPAVASRPLTFTATLTGPQGSYTPGGTVSFFQTQSIGSPASSRPQPLSLLGGISLVNGKATFTVTLNIGSYNIIAMYNGDNNFYPISSDPLAQVVDWIKLYLPGIIRQN